MREIFGLLFIGLVKGIQVDVSGQWRPQLGWEVPCTWTLPPDDRLQSVRLYNNERQFMIYRPEIHGHKHNEFFRTPNCFIRVECLLESAGKEGKCVMLLEPTEPISEDFTYTCEVSGERPAFRIARKDYVVEAFVEPSDAVLTLEVQRQSSPARVVLNCTSSGLPAPTLTWEIDNRRIPTEFAGRAWNASSKLWQSWASVATTVPGARLACSASAARAGRAFKSRPAVYQPALDCANCLQSTTIVLLMLAHLQFSS